MTGFEPVKLDFNQLEIKYRISLSLTDSLRLPYQAHTITLCTVIPPPDLFYYPTWVFRLYGSYASFKEATINGLFLNFPT